jgi:hypothetical protein
MDKVQKNRFFQVQYTLVRTHSIDNTFLLKGSIG